MLYENFEPGSKIKGRVGEQFDEFLRCRRVAADDGAKTGEAGVVGNAGRVGEEMVDGDPVPVLLRVAGEIVRDVPIELQLPLLHELEDEHRGELLRNGAEAEFRVGCVRDVPFHVGEAVAFFEDHLPVLGDEDRAVELPVFDA